MVIAYHVVFSTYGFWLPNDPRGSNSDFVRAEHLRPFGDATKVNHRRSVAGVPHDAALRAAAKRALRLREVRLTGVQARAVARGFAKVIQKSGMVVLACAILPKHVHLVVARHRYRVEQVVNLLKGGATRQLLEEGLHPFAHLADANGSVPTMWGRNCRKVFLNSDREVAKKIEYVEQNPLKEGKKRQRWSFVTGKADVALRATAKRGVIAS